jgi:hypothetical protein
MEHVKRVGCGEQGRRVYVGEAGAGEAAVGVWASAVRTMMPAGSPSAILVLQTRLLRFLELICWVEGQRALVPVGTHHIVDEIGGNRGTHILNSVLQNVSVTVRSPEKHCAPVIQRRKRHLSHFLAHVQALQKRMRIPVSACCAAWRDAAASSWAWE